MNLTVLRTYRTQLEDMLRTELAQLTQALHETEAKRSQLEAEADAKACAYLQKSQAGMTPGEAEDHYAALDSLAALCARMRQHEVELRLAWEQKQADVLDAARERKKLDILDNRQQQKRRLQQERQAQRLLDEVAGRRARRDQD